MPIHGRPAVSKRARIASGGGSGVAKAAGTMRAKFGEHFWAALGFGHLPRENRDFFCGGASSERSGVAMASHARPAGRLGAAKCYSSNTSVQRARSYASMQANSKHASRRGGHFPFLVNADAVTMLSRSRWQCRLAASHALRPSLSTQSARGDYDARQGPRGNRHKIRAVAIALSSPQRRERN
jgi:hypothetical protein